MPQTKHFAVSANDLNTYDLTTRLLYLTDSDPSYTLTQVNGQRIYRKSPHAWIGPEPSRNCEVFVGRIPHDCFEDVLVPLFQQAGELFEFRLMINFSGWNRGYAFAMYTKLEEASNAIRLFNNYMIRPSWQLGVCPSINNCRIYVSRIPANIPSEEIVRILYALTEEVVEVRIRRTSTACAAVVEYRSHRGAAMARKALVAAAQAWGAGARPTVDWSLPQSPQMLRQYREVGRWSAELGVTLTRAADDAYGGCGGGGGGNGVGVGGIAGMGLPAPLPSYTLEPWSYARRLRMIQEAERAAAAAAAAAGLALPPRLPTASPPSPPSPALSLAGAMAAHGFVPATLEHSLKQWRIGSEEENYCRLIAGAGDGELGAGLGGGALSGGGGDDEGAAAGTGSPGSGSGSGAGALPEYNPWTSRYPFSFSTKPIF